MNLDVVFAVEVLPSLETKPRRREKRVSWSGSSWLNSVFSM